MNVLVDNQACQGHGLCVINAPDSFELDDVEGKASPVSSVVPSDQEDAVAEAAEACPEQAILIE